MLMDLQILNDDVAGVIINDFMVSGILESPIRSIPKLITILKRTIANNATLKHYTNANSM